MAVMSNFSEKSNKMHIHVFHMEKSFNGGSDRLISFMVFRVHGGSSECYLDFTIN